jgi:hypothetical protein
LEEPWKPKLFGPRMRSARGHRPSMEYNYARADVLRPFPSFYMNVFERKPLC